ncbi:hypothetical protein [uncultured Cohaesibacter sp.]|nr:hypothetical protein [uncultured Cohaesibacter sp.]
MHEATLRDYLDAVEGYNELHAPPEKPSMSKARFEELKARYG